MKTYIKILMMLIMMWSINAFAAAFTVTFSDDSKKDYDSFTEAVIADSNTTVTMNGNVSCAIGAFVINRHDVTIDFNGYTLTITSGYFYPQNGCDNLVFKNGVLSSADTLFFLQSGSEQVGTITFDGVDITDATCIAYASYGNIVYKNGTYTARWVISQGCASGCTLTVEDSVLAPRLAPTDAGSTYTPANVILGEGVYCNFNPTVPNNWVKSGCIANAENNTVDGHNCTYRVYDNTIAPDVVNVISGTSTNGYKTFADAISVIKTGDTLELLSDVSCSSQIAVNVADLTIDLNGYTLSKTTSGDFFTLNDNSSGFKIKDGTLYSVNSIFNSAGTYTSLEDINLDNCTITGQCVVYGYYGDFYLTNCVATTDYFISQGCGGNVAVYFDGGVIAPNIAPTDNLQDNMYTPALVKIKNGYFTFDPSNWVDDNVVVSAITETISSIACTYKAAHSEVALDAAEVIPVGGGDGVGYATAEAAFAAIQDGETLRLFKRWNVADDANTLTEITKSFTIDLNGFTLANTMGNFLRIAAGCKLTLKNGTILQYENGSVFIVDDSTALVEVDDCVIRGNCIVYGANENGDCAGKVTLKNTDTVTSIMASANGNARLEIIGGKNYQNAVRDAGGFLTGTTITLSGGRYTFNPTAYQFITITDGNYVQYSVYSDGSLTFYYMLGDASSIANCEAKCDNLYFESVQTALSNAADGDTVQLLKDHTGSINIPSPSDYWNIRNLTLDLGGNVFSGNGSIIWVSQGYTLTVKNGAIHALANTSEVFVLGAYANLTLESSVTIDCESDVVGSVINVPNGNLNVVINGANVTMPYLFNANWQSMTATLNGEMMFSGADILYPQSPTPDDGAITIAEGYYSFDPTQYVSDETLKIRDYGDNYAAKNKPCRYAVVVPESGLFIFIK